MQYSVASGANSYSRYVSALNTEGAVQWSKALPGEFLGTGDDNSLYFADTLTLQKYDASGSLLWSRNVVLSTPYTTEPTAAPTMTLATRGDDIYILVNFFRNAEDTSRGDVGNTEIKRYTANGVEVWSHPLYPAETGSPADDYRTFPVGITFGADLYLLVESKTFDDSSSVSTYTQQLHRFFADGQHTFTGLQKYSDGVRDVAFAPAQITDSLGLPETAFYSVSTTGEMDGCKNYMDLSKPCVYKDAITSLYTVDGASDRKGLYAHLQWGSR